MANHYQSLLDTAYATFLNACVNYPAAGKDSKPVLQDAQRLKVANLVSDGTSSLSTTLSACAEVLEKAQGKQYHTKAALEADIKKTTPLLKAQTQALAALFDGFKREEDAWVKQAATLSQDARSGAVKAQRAVAAQFVAAVQGLESTVSADMNEAVAAWKSDVTPTPEPTPKPTPTTQADPVDWQGQREALMDAALNGVPCVEINPALKAA